MPAPEQEAVLRLLQEDDEAGAARLVASMSRTEAQYLLAVATRVATLCRIHLEQGALP